MGCIVIVSVFILNIYVTIMIIIMRSSIIIIIIILVLVCSRACEGAVLEREGASDAGQALDVCEAGISTLCLLSLIFSEFVRCFLSLFLF